MNNIFLEPILYVYVLGGEALKTASGGIYWKIKVLTPIEKAKEIGLKIWDCGENPEQNSNLPQKGDYLKIVIGNLQDFEDEYLLEKSRFSITIEGKGNKSSWSKINKSKIPAEYLDLLVSKYASAEQIEKAWTEINLNKYWECDENYKFIMTVLDEIGRKKFEEAPAAKSCHHNYKGGLLIHTSEVLRSARYNVLSKSNYDFINGDVVYGSAILHDVGKTLTFSCDELNIPDSSEEEAIIGHPYYSMYYLNKIVQQVGFENKDYIKEVLHCIAAHHGKPEWGAVVSGMTPEALILHNADYESSKIESYKDLLLKSTAEQKFMKNFNERFYITCKSKKMKSEGKIN